MARRAALHTTTYGKFKGVDFSTDASLVDSYRSPWAVNMIADTGGMPEKRMGWRTLHQIEKPVNGLFYGVVQGETRFLAHGGTKLYEWTPGREPEEGAAWPKVLKDGLFNGPSAGVNIGGKLWLLTGGDYLVFDGESVQDVESIAYIPTTVIAAAPTGGGEAFESINLLQPQRKNEFIPDGEAKVYQLDSTGLGAEAVTATVRGVAKTEGTDFTVNRVTGTVTFRSPPAKPLVGQEGEVVITFSKRTTGYKEKITKCGILTTYGVGSSDRVVISGNPEFPNQDWTSGLNDPTYFPDLSYAVVGLEATAIVGYRRIGEFLAVIKEDNGQDTTVFLRSASLSGEGEPVFPLKQSIAGVGAVSKRGFGNLLDEQLFLSGTGVCALTASTVTAERIVQNRSFFVDSRLTRERGLDKAVAVSWNGMFLVAVNAHVYLLDGRQDKTYRAKSQSDFVYECYYWEHVPAACWMNHKGAWSTREQGTKAGAEGKAQGGTMETLYFGTEDGRICRFNSDVDTMARYADDGGAISAVWSTKADDDGDVTLLKTMIKKGNSVTIKPYTRSSAKICFRTEQDPVDWQAAYDLTDIFDWEDLDFTRFTFNANDAPREVLFNTKVKKYKRLQIIVKNDAVNEGFGLFEISKHYVVGNFAKR